MHVHVVITAVLAANLLVSSASADDNWPQFRGKDGLGLASGHPPTEWDIATGKNVEWISAVPGLGHASPIVWGDRIFLATATSPNGEKPSLQTGWIGGAGDSADDKGYWTWQLICLDLKTGATLWNQDAYEGEPAIKRHVKGSHANCTPATDGKHVVAFFGSEGLYCYDFEGLLKWECNFGRLHSGPYDDKKLEWGFASSPIIYNGHVIVQCDCLNTNFIAILDVETGKELRRIDRDGEVATWSTPTIVTIGNKTQIVCNGYRKMAGYDFETGEPLWFLSNGGDVPVPTPLFANDLIYLTSGHRAAPTFAVKPTATGDLTPGKDKPLNDGLAWWESKDGAYMPTPLVKDGLLYTCNDDGRLAVRDAKTGKLRYRQRVGTGTRAYSASAVSADNHIYFTSESGEVTVIAAGKEFRPLASNNVGEVVLATPAIAGDRLLIRSIDHLVCIKQSPQKGDR